MILAALLAALVVCLVTAPGRHLFAYEWTGIGAVQQFFSTGRIPVTGSRALGESFHQPGPLYPLLLCLAYAISPDVLSGYWVTGLLDVLTALGCFLVGKRYFSARTGLWCVAWYLATWMAILGRDLETIACLPFFILLVLAASLELVMRGNARMVMLLPPLLAAALQIHLCSLSVLPAVAWALASSRRLVRARDLLVGVGLALVVMSPYLLGGLQEDWPALLQLNQHPRLTRQLPYLQILLHTFILGPRMLVDCRVTPLDLKHPGLTSAIAIVLWTQWLCSLVALSWLAVQLRCRSATASWRSAGIFLILVGVGPYLMWSISEGLAVFLYLLPAQMGHVCISAIWCAALTRSNPRAESDPSQTARVLPQIVGAGLVILLVANAAANMRAFLPGQTLASPDPYHFTEARLSGRPVPLHICPRLEDHPLFQQRSILKDEKHHHR